MDRLLLLVSVRDVERSVLSAKSFVFTVFTALLTLLVISTCLVEFLLLFSVSFLMF